MSFIMLENNKVNVTKQKKVIYNVTKDCTSYKVCCSKNLSCKESVQTFWFKTTDRRWDT